MELFAYTQKKQMEKEGPLAARMRPRTLEEYIGQEHILAPGRLLRRAIQADQLSSLIFYGPPGTGKTTLAAVIANTTRSHFVSLNAVLTGVKELREVTDQAQDRRLQHGRRTILFVDEVHRWNKAQQDALLPWVENGTIILIGATTENPFFSVNRALVSRSRVFQLQPLTPEALRQVALQAIRDPERGYGKLAVSVDDEALAHLVDVANGDARTLLNAVELAVETTSPDAAGQIRITTAVAEESIQKRAVLYDKEGDYHFDTISAFIKSMRGSDPDAAVYWLAKMVHAGEDPQFLFRRMVIFAGEDVGLADPQALTVVMAAAAAFDRVGMPEGRYHLGMAALYLATAPKSNSVFAFFDALAAVEKEADSEVPNPLKDASRDKEGFGHGAGYLYPHAYRDHWVAQQYLPDSLQGKVFYDPGELGYEQQIAETVRRRRELQLAATLEGDGTAAPREILTFSPADKAAERWLARATGNASARLGSLRDRIFAAASLPRHGRILDLTADTGLLTWEALRQVPEGGVWSLVSQPKYAQALQEQAERLPELRRPQPAIGLPAEARAALAAAGAGDVRFELVAGRNALGRLEDKPAALRQWAGLLAADGVLVLAETVVAATQRLYALVPAERLPARLRQALAAAEEAIYANPADPLVNWNATTAAAWARDAGLELDCETETATQEQWISPAQVAQWFAAGAADGRPSYAEHLRQQLSEEDVALVAALYRQTLAGQAVPWKTTTLLLRFSRSPGDSR